MENEQQQKEEANSTAQKTAQDTSTKGED